MMMSQNGGPSPTYAAIPVQTSEQSGRLAIDCRWRLGRHRIDVSVAEASIDGFTVMIGLADAPRLRLGRRWSLRHNGSTLPVLARWFYQSPDGPVQVGLQRLDTGPARGVNCFVGQTKPGRRPSRLVRRPTTTLTIAAALAAGVVLITSLPGTGDRLGAAQPVRKAFDSLLAVWQ